MKIFLAGTASPRNQTLERERRIVQAGARRRLLSYVELREYPHYLSFYREYAKEKR